MHRNIFFVIFLISINSVAQKIAFPKNLSTADSSLIAAMPALANQVIALYKDDNKATYYENLFRYQITAGQYQAAVASLDSTDIFYGDTATRAKVIGIQFRTYALTKEAQRSNHQPFAYLYPDTLAALYNRLPEEAKPVASQFFASDPEQLKATLDGLLQGHAGKDSLTLGEARSLLRTYNSWNVYRQVMPPAKAFLAAEDTKKYIIQDSVLITVKDGAKLSAVIVRRRSTAVPLPVVLMYNIYAGDVDLGRARQAAEKGFAGIVLNTRGKKQSLQAIDPFEHDGSDVYDAIDWISKQPWCNGKVGMYGGSYLGFSQWSAAKKLHPALKTIVPQVAVGIGIDYPLHNGVFMSYMLRWIHYVTNNKLTDDAEFRDEDRWNNLYGKWYKSGASFRSLDTLDGRPNAVFQRWLAHPTLDSYWQNMVPYGKEFAAINIPILTTTGYFDDDQRGAFYYMMEHTKWNKAANHYLLIGPYDHGAAQSAARPEIMGFKIDPVANININETVFKWFNHILKDSALPPMLKDKINYEVTGANQWRSAPDLKAVSNDSILFYLSNTKIKEGYKLARKVPPVRGSILQEISYTDRNEIDLAEHPLIDTELHTGERLVFISEPLTEDVIMNGSFEGVIKATLNKKDIDLAADLYELQTDGKYIALSTYLGRASYVRDRTRRQLLQPGREETLPIINSYFISRQLKKGSRIVVTIGMNKNPNWQVNYGSGKDVSDETIADGKVPMQIEWHNNSYIKLPVLR